MRQDVASILSAGRIDGFVAFLDVLDDAVFVDYERSAIAVAALFIEDAVVFYHRVFYVAQDRKSNAVLFRELRIGKGAVDAEAENLGIICFEFGDISLIRLHLFRSTAGKGEYIEGQDDIFLALKV